MKQYICLASEPWQAVPTRTQQLMTRLKDAEILFFEPSGKGKEYKRPGRRVRPGLVLYTLPPIIDVEERHTYLFRRTRQKLARFIESKMDRHRFREPVLWMTSPAMVHLTDHLSYRGLVYDCDREWSRLPIQWESDLALSADVIFAASPGLIERLSPCNDNIALIPNGANHSLFSQDSLAIPPELEGFRGPVLGYAGTLWRDLDLAPVLLAAQTCTDGLFVFVGRQDTQHPQYRALKALHNVAFIGHKPPVELPNYLARFDVCLNLLRKRDSHSDIIPPRIYEYLSTGKPIVSMLYSGQVERFPDVIYSAHTAGEFAQLCERALSEVGDWARRRRRDYGATCSWNGRVQEIARILETIGLY